MLSHQLAGKRKTARWNAARSVGLWLAWALPIGAQQGPVPLPDFGGCNDPADLWECDEFDASPLGSLPEGWSDIGAVGLSRVRQALDFQSGNTQVVEIQGSPGTSQGILRRRIFAGTVYTLRVDFVIVADTTRGNDNFPFEIAFSDAAEQRDIYCCWSTAGVSVSTTRWVFFDLTGSLSTIQQVGFQLALRTGRWYRATFEVDTETGTQRGEIFDLETGVSIASREVTHQGSLGKTFSAIYVANHHRGNLDGENVIVVDNVIYGGVEPAEPPAPRFRRGDCNVDGEVNIADATCILKWLFVGGEDPGCVAATNTNGDEAANITDATYLLNHLFAGGPALLAPFPDCGPGQLPADAELGCANPPSCQ